MLEWDSAFFTLKAQEASKLSSFCVEKEGEAYFNIWDAKNQSQRVSIVNPVDSKLTVLNECNTGVFSAGLPRFILSLLRPRRQTAYLARMSLSSRPQLPAQLSLHTSRTRLMIVSILKTNLRSLKNYWAKHEWRLKADRTLQWHSPNSAIMVIVTAYRGGGAGRAGGGQTAGGGVRPRNGRSLILLYCPTHLGGTAVKQQIARLTDCKYLAGPGWQ